MQEDVRALDALRDAARSRHAVPPTRPGWQEFGAVIGVVLPLLLSVLSLAFYVDRTLTEHSVEIRRIESAQEGERAEIADLRGHVDDKFREVSTEIFDLATGAQKRADTLPPAQRR